MPTKREISEMDHIVDDVVHDELVARKLKHALHAQFENDDEKKKAKSEDDADLWDNLPV